MGGGWSGSAQGRETDVSLGVSLSGRDNNSFRTTECVQTRSLAGRQVELRGRNSKAPVTLDMVANRYTITRPYSGLLSKKLFVPVQSGDSIINLINDWFIIDS